uniref:Glycosyl transferase family 1 domain-containing protein n=1 Tax=Leptocylindrus danicus TaxID=163516 RepID=A0A7S2LQ07_9STRA|mmetsp:Transcript_772/g.1071  ORF Transcript_772/g.1071 Transcript_772/m.1071 type:complete len:118 (+) Transcript_772:1-354(+)
MTIWLESGDYPKFLGCADLGISLHTSTSGIDLPMKVLDFYGGELPVCARNFQCLDELVQHGNNGMVFESSAELADQMFDLLVNEDKYLKLKEGVRGMTRWRENWINCAADIIQKASS